MKKILILLYFFCTLPHVYSQASYYVGSNVMRKEYPEDYGFLNNWIEFKNIIKAAKVKKRVSYNYMLENIKKIPDTLLPSGKPFLYEETYFDTSGNIIKVIEKDSRREHISTYSYNSKGLLAEIVSNKDSSDEYKLKLSYDSSGNPVLFDSFSKTDYKRKKTYCEYDSCNNLYKVRFYIDDSLTKKTNYWYDESGNASAIETIYYITNDTDLVSYKTVYDKVKRVVRRNNYNKTGKLSGTDKYSYKNGMVSKKIYKWRTNNGEFIYNSKGFLKKIIHRTDEDTQINTNSYNELGLITKIFVVSRFKDHKDISVTWYVYEFYE